MTPEEIESVANLGRWGLLVDVRPFPAYHGCVVESWLLRRGLAEIRFNWFNFETGELFDEGEITFRTHYDSVATAARELAAYLGRPPGSWTNVAQGGWTPPPGCWHPSSRSPDAHARLLRWLETGQFVLPRGTWTLVDRGGAPAIEPPAD
ncbi:MAG: hypothetical protein R3B06_21280 [Kofleriaceae bacterium]